MNIKQVFLFLLLCLLSFLSAGAEKFLLPQKTKKFSKNELKESIGQKIRDAFMVTISVASCAGSCQVTIGKMQENKGSAYPNLSCLQKTLGMLHIELAHIQQKLSQLVERLVDDQKPFKHSSREGLHNALNVVHDVCRGLKDREGQLDSLNKRLAKITGERAGATVIAIVEDIKGYAIRINSCDGLKIT